MPISFKTGRGFLFWRRALSSALISGLLWSAPGGVFLPMRRASAAGPDALVRCDPATPSSPYNTDVAVNIYVEDVVDLYAADTRLTFDTSMAQVVDAEDGMAGVQIEPLNSFLVPGWVVRQEADNTAGTLWYAATQFNPTPPANGSGPLAQVTFHPLSYGSFNLNFTYVKLATRDGAPITSTTQGCLVNFTTPLPTTTGLVPDNALANSGAFDLTVNGTNFIDGSEVYWKGVARPTTYISSTQVLASIPATDLETAGPISVTVVNPLPGGGASNPQTFTVNTHAHFTEAAYSAGEAAGAAPVDVVLDAPSTLTVTVAVTATGGTATLADYGVVSETLIFAPGTVTQTVNISLTDDALDELDETVLLGLSAPANVLLGTLVSATLTIVDDDISYRIYLPTIWR
jgi:hypothetical protein